MAVKQVFFRVDGDAKIGLGHLVRCIALAQMLQSSFSITFISKKIPQGIVNQLKHLGIDLQQIKEEGDFLNYLTGNEIVVIDHYGLGTEYQRELKAKKSKLVCIDDVHDKTFFADLIINHAPGVKSTDYSAQAYTRFALGLDYVLLRPEFLKRAETAPNRKYIETAFICFGGSDPKNITQVVIDILKVDNRFKEIIVVIGTSYDYTKTLKLSIKQDDRFKIYHAVNADEMCDLILLAQLAIVPASGILQEAISLNTKIISGMYVDNQKFIFENYRQINAFESAGDFQPDKIVSAINRCFQNQVHFTGQRLIDGKSGKRLLDIFKSL